MRQQRDQVWNDAAIDDQLDLFISAVGQVAESPDGVDENVYILIVNEVTEGWKDLIDGLNWWWWILVAAQIHNHPGDITEEANRDVRFDEGE